MKTADEMFLSLGYYQGNKSGSYLCADRQREISFPIEEIKHGWMGKVVVVDGDRIDSLTYNEILACAQLIKEIEADYGTQR